MNHINERLWVVGIASKTPKTLRNGHVQSGLTRPRTSIYLVKARNSGDTSGVIDALVLFCFEPSVKSKSQKKTK
jgi:hypothetical protein